MSDLQPLSRNSHYHLETAANLVIENEAIRAFDGPTSLEGEEAEGLVFPDIPTVALTRYELDKLIKLVGDQPCSDFSDIYDKLKSTI